MLDTDKKGITVHCFVFVFKFSEPVYNIYGLVYNIFVFKIYILGLNFVFQRKKYSLNQEITLNKHVYYFFKCFNLSLSFFFPIWFSLFSVISWFKEYVFSEICNLDFIRRESDIRCFNFQTPQVAFLVFWNFVCLFFNLLS